MSSLIIHWAVTLMQDNNENCRKKKELTKRSRDLKGHITQATGDHLD
jgi:hypothetical protein